MKQEQHTHSPNRKKVYDQVRLKTPASIIDLIAVQLDRADDAKRRIEEEGIVVRNMSGSVVEHPCVKTEIAATKLACELISKYGRGSGN